MMNSMRDREGRNDALFRNEARRYQEISEIISDITAAKISKASVNILEVKNHENIVEEA